jgi:G3E family GTPase
MVTVVDALNFLRDYRSDDALATRAQALGPDDTRSVVELLVEQVEFADVIVLNKLDQVDESEQARLRGVLQALNPQAQIIGARFGQVPLAAILNTGRFDFERAERAPGWMSELRGEHVPETEAFGIKSFAWRARRPLHPQRFWDLLQREWPGVLRSKGFFWLASRFDEAGLWSQAGVLCRPASAGAWWAATDPADWPDEPDLREEIDAVWQAPYGDRRQELVFIGMGHDEAGMRAALDACVLTDAELSAGPQAWCDYPDPFPDWAPEMQEADLDEDQDEEGEGNPNRAPS